MKKSPPELPFELWLQIFGRLPPVEIYTTMLRVCPVWRRLIIDNRRSLPMIPTQCHVFVMNDGEDYSFHGISIPGTGPSVRYSFITLHDRKRGKRETRCRMLRTLHVSHGSGDLMGEMEPLSRRVFNPMRIDSRVTRQCMSFMNVTSLRYDVYARPGNGLYGVNDENLVWSFVFLNNYCGNLNLRSASLRSLNPSYHWRFGPRTRHLMANLCGLRSLELTNLDDAAFIIGHPSTSSLRHLKELTLRAESSHVEYSENLTVIAADGQHSILDNLLSSNKQPAFSLEAFRDTPTIVLDISLRDICDFVRAWMWSLKPWLFHSLCFNSTVGANELASRMGVLPERIPNDPSQQRFWVPHNEHDALFMEITCSYRGVSTMWTLWVHDHSAIQKHRANSTSEQRLSAVRVP